VMNQQVHDDELSVMDLIAFIRSNFRMILGCAIAGVVLALAVVLTITPQWEANALVRIGQFGNTVSSGNTISTVTTGNSVEPSLQVVDRVKSQSFQDDVLLSLSLLTDQNHPKAKMLRDKLKVKLEKSELISLTLRAESAEDANIQLTAVVNQLRSIHEKILEPTVNRWRQELALLNLQLQQSRDEMIRLKTLLNASLTSNEKNFSQFALISNVLITREAELRSFIDTKRTLEERLSSERTFSTQVQGRVEVSESPVFPNKRLFLMVGFMLGLVLGVLIALIKPVLRAMAK
jgi:capsular polysaccharide biosynthesis protein